MKEVNKRGILGWLLSVILIIFVMLITVSFSIGIPIYFRPLYYAQIGPLGIEEATGLTRGEIIAGYDEVLDYLTRPGGEFSAGAFAYSEEGKSHFEDCKVLFTLNATVYVISALVISLIFLVKKLCGIKIISPLGLMPGFWSGALTLSVFGVIGVLAALDFDRAFYIFHTVFFPGKDNWMFNPNTDEIIMAMPEQFFAVCALSIGLSVILISLTLMAIGFYCFHLNRKKGESIISPRKIIL